MSIQSRPVSIAHLVFGLIFLGGAALWAVGAATDAATPDLALMAPIILIGAGVIGLVAMVVNARRRDAGPLEPPAAPETTTVEQENQS
jgi:hypothetical protein